MAEKKQAWAERHRPTRLADLVGQDEACEDIAAIVADGFRSLVICGPTGSGKTTLGRLYANTALCEEPLATGDACGICHSCRAIHDHRQRGVLRFNGSSLTRADLAEIQDYQRTPPAGRVVVLIDEAADIRSDLQNALCTMIDDHPRRDVFIFALIDPRDVSRPVLDRTRTVKLRAATIATRLCLLQRVAHAQNLSVEPGALDLIASADASLRALCGHLERLGISGTITVNDVRTKLLRDRAQRPLDYLLAAAAGDYDATLQAFEGSELAPGERTAAVRDLAAQVFAFDLGPRAATSPVTTMPRLIDDHDASRLLAALEARAEAFDLPVTQVGGMLLQHLADLPPAASEAAFVLEARRLCDFLNPNQPHVLTPADIDGALFYGAEVGRRPQMRAELLALKASPFRRKRVAGPNTGEATPHLGIHEVQAIFNAASFSIQEHRAPLNCALHVGWSRHAPRDHEITQKVGELLHRLGKAHARLLRTHKASKGREAEASARTNVGDPDASKSSDLKYISTFTMTERSRRRDSLVAFHAHPSIATELCEWLGIRAEREFAVLDPEVISWVSDPSSLYDDPRRVIRRHRDLVRSLLATIDPTIEWRGKPLYGLLGISEDVLRTPLKVTTRRFNIGKSINNAAQVEATTNVMAPLSALRDAAWDHLWSGWEFAEFRHRQRTQRLRTAQVLELRRQLATGEIRQHDEFNARLNHLIRRWPSQPKNRARPGRGAWWFEAFDEEQADV